MTEIVLYLRFLIFRVYVYIYVQIDRKKIMMKIKHLSLFLDNNNCVLRQIRHRISQCVFYYVSLLVAKCGKN